MCKKFAVLAITVAAVVALLSFTKAGSYGRTLWKQARESACRNVPVELEIQRLKDEVDRLTPDLKKNIGTVANEMARVQRLEDEINQTRDNLEKQKEKLLQMTGDLKGGETEFIKNGKVYSRKDMAEKFSQDWESYKRAEADLATRVQILESRKQKLEIAKAQLSEIQKQERTLRLQIEQLETDLQLVRLAQTQNTVVLDDSRLSDIKRSMSDLQERITAEKMKAELEARFFPNSYVQGIDTQPPRPISEVVKEAEDYLRGPKVASGR
jgi:chromosome segregation ATPase